MKRMVLIMEENKRGKESRGRYTGKGVSAGWFLK